LNVSPPPNKIVPSTCNNKLANKKTQKICKDFANVFINFHKKDKISVKKGKTMALFAPSFSSYRLIPLLNVLTSSKNLSNVGISICCCASDNATAGSG